MSSQNPAYIDPRGSRFGATVTTVVLAIVLLTSSGWLLLFQAAVFAIGALSGLKYAPYGYVYRVLVQPRLAKPTELEHPAPPTFSQAFGFFFVAPGVIGYLAHVTVLGVIFAALTLAAAFLNAAFDICVGCETYLLFRRSTVRRRPVGP